jgi:VIT1/CCC1 family predicted Fe2+/Mn2+ transporter
MSKKKLLSEAQVKRFMGLAGLNPINESYMDEDMYEEKHQDPMMEAEEEMPEMDMEKEEPEAEAGDVDAEVDEDKLMKGLQGLKDGLEVLEDIASAAGLEGGEEMPEEEPEMDMDDEEPAGDDDMDMDAELEDVDMEATEEEEKEQMEEIVNEVARRVAKRIVEAKRAHKKMNEALGRKK